MTAIIQIALMRVALCGLAASFVLFALRSRVARTSAARLLSAWHDLTALGRVTVCSFLLVGILVGGDKTNNVPPNLNSPLPQMMQDGGSFQAGFTGLAGMGNLVNLVNPIQTGHSVQQSFAQRKATNWNVRGAWKDSFWLDFEDGWVFPWGTNHLFGVEVVSFGQVWPTPFDTNAVAAAGAPFEIVRGLTTFAYEFTPSNSYRFVWTDAAINRDTNNLITASIELLRCGDVAIATNGASWTIPRELPFAHDSYGQDADWVAANFTNATEIAAAGGYAAWVDAQVGEGLTNGLYKLMVSLTNPPPEVINLTVGDWSVAVTNVGAYVFLLEKGTRYTIGLSHYMDGFSYACDDGFEAAAPRLLRGPVNSPAYSVLLTASGDAGGVELVAPSSSGDGSVIYYPWLSLSPSREVDPTFPILLSASVFDLPQGAYPTIEWQTNNLTVATGENFLWYDDEDIDSIDVVATCRDAILHGHYSIERHVRTSEIRLAGGGLIIVEDAYTNAPGEVVSASSTSVCLDFSWSLAEEGTLTLESNSAAFALSNEYGTTFSLPYSWHGSVDEEDDWRLFASCTDTTQTGPVGDFVFTFTPDAPTAAMLTRTVGVDVVKIRVEADAAWPSNKVRHVFGPLERYNVTCTPSCYGTAERRAPLGAGEHAVAVELADFTYATSIRVVHPTGVPRFEFVRMMNASDWRAVGCEPPTNTVPGVGIVANRYLLPSYVSFAGLLVKEGEAPATDRMGWFANPVNDFIYGHGDENCEVVSVTAMENKIEGFDRIGVLIAPPPTEYGSFNLHIPMYWGVVTNSWCTNFFATVTQHITADVDGVTTISKGGITKERNCLE